MKWNPYLNALAAAAYIGLLVLFLHTIEALRHDTPDTWIDGIGFISLFVFSAAMMAFLFFYQPLVRLIDHKPSEALSYFLKTLGTFGVILVGVLVLVFAQ
jgi:hypothetical protein